MDIKKILIVEDEGAIRELVVFNLIRAGYSVLEAESGEQALELFEKNFKAIDIALLDVMLPGIDGFEVCSKLREQDSALGIIMLTAKSQEVDKVSGLLKGADDYITKPFSPTELIARVDALYRRVDALRQKIVETQLKSGPFLLNIKNRTLFKDGKNIEITQIEFMLLKAFMENKENALSREKLLDMVWGEAYYGELKIVDVNIRRLRMKLEINPSDPQYIQTIWGFGYKWGITE